MAHQPTPQSVELMNRYPAIADLARRAKRRIPHFAWEYLDSGTGADHGVQRNRDAFNRVTLTPQFMKGPLDPDMSTKLFGVDYQLPFGVAPIGLTGLMWPGAEIILARCAAQYRMPYTLSTVATETPETIGPVVNGMGWFQLYPPNDPVIRRDILERAKKAGFTTLVITADTPAQSQRERQRRAEVSVPPKRTLRTWYRAAIRPAWSVATVSHGLPRFRTMEQYANTTDIAQIGQYMNENMGTLDWQYLADTRREWEGPMLVKGILNPADASRCIDIGADGVIVSNHGARQFDGAPATMDALPPIVDALGPTVPVILDSGVRGGLDICRALALGAHFVLLGRAFMYGVSAFGERGASLATDILIGDLKSNMANLGCATLAELSERR